VLPYAGSQTERSERVHEFRSIKAHQGHGIAGTYTSFLPLPWPELDQHDLAGDPSEVTALGVRHWITSFVDGNPNIDKELPSIKGRAG
jgi:hypothetical protein